MKTMKYGTLEFESGAVVNGVVSDTVLESDRDNTMIALLPERVEYTDVLDIWVNRFTETVMDHSKPAFDRMSQVELLDDLRFALPFDQRLRDAFRLILQNSLRKRWKEKCPANLTMMFMDQEMKDNLYLKPLLTGFSGTSASVIGYGGCGKTRSVKALLAEYPQFIRYTMPGGRWQMMVYLYVEAPSNGDYSGLFAAIGAAADKACGNFGTHYYEQIVKRAHSVTDKARAVADIIQGLKVGVLVIDEVQKMNFDGLKGGTIQSIMTILNGTHVGLITLGTMQAFTKMFLRDEWLARRGGIIINASRYCGNYDYFKTFIRSYFSLQWFPKHVEPDENMCRALYDCSGGILDRLKDIYKQINQYSIRYEANLEAKLGQCKTEKERQAVLADTPPLVIDAALVRKIAEMNYPGYETIVAATRRTDPTADHNLKKLANDEIHNALLQDAMEQDEYMKSVYKDVIDKHWSDGSDKQDDLVAPEDGIDVDRLKSVLAAVMLNLTQAGEASKYSSDTIAKVVTKALKAKRNQDKADNELITLCIQRVRSGKSEGRPRTRNPLKHIPSIEELEKPNIVNE